MTAIAPNLTILVGELVGARLIAHAGSLINLAKQPASTVQILGAEKALFRWVDEAAPVCWAAAVPGKVAVTQASALCGDGGCGGRGGGRGGGQSHQLSESSTFPWQQLMRAQHAA
jgi:hypothetical protein